MSDQIMVTASVSVQGLRAGETGLVDRNSEVDALIGNGRLTPVDATEVEVEEVPETEPEPEPKKKPKAVDS